MKKILVLFILAYGQLFALDKDSTLKIYHHVFAALVPKATIGVYTEDEEYKRVFSLSKRMILKPKLKKADIALITNERELKRILRESVFLENNPPILFVTDHRLLKKSDEIVGAFYWRKGRSQLLFIKKRLDAYHITLPQEFNEYIVDEI